MTARFFRALFLLAVFLRPPGVIAGERAQTADTNAFFWSPVQIHENEKARDYWNNLAFYVERGRYRLMNEAIGDLSKLPRDSWIRQRVAETYEVYRPIHAALADLVKDMDERTFDEYRRFYAPRIENALVKKDPQEIERLYRSLPGLDPDGRLAHLIGLIKIERGALEEGRRYLNSSGRNFFRIAPGTSGKIVSEPFGTAAEKKTLAGLPAEINYAERAFDPSVEYGLAAVFSPDDAFPKGAAPTETSDGEGDGPVTGHMIRVVNGRQMVWVMRGGRWVQQNPPDGHVPEEYLAPYLYFSRDRVVCYDRRAAYILNRKTLAVKYVLEHEKVKPEVSDRNRMQVWHSAAVGEKRDENGRMGIILGDRFYYFFLPADESAGAVFYCVDVSSGKVVFKKHISGRSLGKPTLFGGSLGAVISMPEDQNRNIHAYGSTFGYWFVTLDPETGEILNREKIGREDGTANFAASSGNAPRFEMIDTPDACYGLLTSGVFFKARKETGSIDWIVRLNRPYEQQDNMAHVFFNAQQRGDDAKKKTKTNPTVFTLLDDTVVVSLAKSPDIQGWNVRTGEFAWRIREDTRDLRACLTRGFLFTARNEMELTDPDGRTLWKIPIDAPRFQSPVFASDGRHVLYRSAAGLYAVDIATGRRVWNLDFSSQSTGPIFNTDEGLYASCSEQVRFFAAGGEGGFDASFDDIRATLDGVENELIRSTAERQMLRLIRNAVSVQAGDVKLDRLADLTGRVGDPELMTELRRIKLENLMRRGDFSGAIVELVPLLYNFGDAGEMSATLEKIERIFSSAGPRAVDEAANNLNERIGHFEPKIRYAFYDRFPVLDADGKRRSEIFAALVEQGDAATLEIILRRGRKNIAATEIESLARLRPRLADDVIAAYPALAAALAIVPAPPPAPAKWLLKTSGLDLGRSLRGEDAWRVLRIPGPYTARIHSTNGEVEINERKILTLGGAPDRTAGYQPVLYGDRLYFFALGEIVSCDMAGNAVRRIRIEEKRHGRSVGAFTSWLEAVFDPDRLLHEGMRRLAASTELADLAATFGVRNATDDSFRLNAALQNERRFRSEPSVLSDAIAPFPPEPDGATAAKLVVRPIMFESPFLFVNLIEEQKNRPWGLALIDIASSKTVWQIRGIGADAAALSDWTLRLYALDKNRLYTFDLLDGAYLFSREVENLGSAQLIEAVESGNAAGIIREK